MANVERIRQTVYTSPSGSQFELSIDDVERSGGKKAAIHELPQQSKASVQDLGNIARRFPAAVYFSGTDSDTQSDAFWDALSEEGPGKLAHPRWGDITVLPVSWSQTERMVDGLNRVDFKIDFVEAPERPDFPITAISIDAAVGDSVASALSESSEIAAASVEFSSAADQARTRADILSFTQSFDQSFRALVAPATDAAAQFRKIIRQIETTIDTLIETPGRIFDEFVSLGNLVAALPISIAGKLQAFFNHITGIARVGPNTATASDAELTISRVTVAGQIATIALGGAIAASTVGQMASRTDAINSEQTLEQLSVKAAEYLEALESRVAVYRPNAETVSELSEAEASARASLLERAYSLRSERRLTLATDRTPIDLVSQFYNGSLDNLDEFIEANRLEGSDILIIPAGREVVYYA